MKISALLSMAQSIEPVFELEVSNEIIQYSELKLENLINFKDESATFKVVSQRVKRRLANKTIVDNLKTYYNYRCQICGQRYYDTYSVDISEGHHLDPFIRSLNNNASNIIILCPNHHRLMHAAHPELDLRQKIFTYPNGLIEQIQINDHL